MGIGIRKDILKDSFFEYNFDSNKMALRNLFSNSDFYPDVRNFLKGSTLKSRDFRIKSEGNIKTISFFSDANNPGYGKLYELKINFKTKQVFKQRKTIGPNGEIINIKGNL